MNNIYIRDNNERPINPFLTNVLRLKIELKVCLENFVKFIFNNLQKFKMKNKQIAFSAGAVLLISFFLPAMQFMGLVSISMMTLLTDFGEGYELIFFPICALAALFFVYKNAYSFAKIAFIIPLLIIIYYTFLKEGYTISEVVDYASTGFYTSILSSIVGFMFSKKEPAS